MALLTRGRVEAVHNLVDLGHVSGEAHATVPAVKHLFHELMELCLDILSLFLKICISHSVLGSHSGVHYVPQHARVLCGFSPTWGLENDRLKSRLILRLEEVHLPWLNFLGRIFLNNVNCGIDVHLSCEHVVIRVKCLRGLENLRVVLRLREDCRAHLDVCGKLLLGHLVL